MISWESTKINIVAHLIKEFEPQKSSEGGAVSSSWQINKLRLHRENDLLKV